MTPTRLSDSVFQKNEKGHCHKVKIFGMVGNVLTQGRHLRSFKIKKNVLEIVRKHIPFVQELLEGTVLFKAFR